MCAVIARYHRWQSVLWSPAQIALADDRTPHQPVSMPPSQQTISVRDVSLHELATERS